MPATEPASIDSRRVLRVGAAVFATAIGLCAVLYWWVHVKVIPPAAELRTSASIPPVPRLQAHPERDLESLREAEQRRLDGYEWLDEQHAAARIPVTRAMELYAQRHAGRVAPGTSEPQ